MTAHRLHGIVLTAALLLTACTGGGGAVVDATSDASLDATSDASPDAAAGQDSVTDTGIGDAGTDVPRIPVKISKLAVIAHPANPLAAYVEWKTNVPASTTLGVDCGPDHRVEITTSGSREVHRVFAMGLFDGAECVFTATSVGSDDSSDEALGSFTAGPLPEDLPIPELLFGALDVVQPGWTLFNLTNTFDNIPLHVVLVDSKGRYRWVHRRSGPYPGLDTDVRFTDQGISIGGTTHQDTPSIIDWEGHILWDGDFFNHHDFGPSPGKTGRFLAFTGEKDACGWGFNSQVVVEHDLETKKNVWEWRLCEHWTPPQIIQDWSHLNTIDVFPGGDALLLSSRSQNTLFKVSYPGGELLWGLGEQGDFAYDPGMTFYHQHTPTLTPDGTILMFDNGLHDEREWSRALEISYDPQTKTAQKVWEFRPDPDIYAPVWGDADRLPNGNTLVVFGLWNPQEHTHLIEVAPDADDLWHLRFPKRWGVYRAQRIPEPLVGYIIKE
ncbi:MAG: aryl-sulfate sulfotransferase [Pseudomonadota bacterium]